MTIVVIYVNRCEAQLLLIMFACTKNTKNFYHDRERKTERCLVIMAHTFADSMDTKV